MKKYFTLFLFVLIAQIIQSQLLVKDSLPVILLKDKTIITETEGESEINLSDFRYNEDFSLEIRAKVNTPYSEPGMELQVMNESGFGFRFSINECQISRGLSSYLSKIPIKNYLDNNKYANYRIAKKSDSIFLYRDGVFIGKYPETRIGDAIFDGSFNETLQSSDNQYNNSLNADVWFSDASGFNSYPSIRLVRSESQVSNMANNRNAAIYLPYNNNSYSGNYLSTPIGLEKNKNYTLKFNLLSWGGNGLGKKLKIMLASNKEGTKNVIGETIFTSSIVNSTPFAYVPCQANFTAQELDLLAGRDAYLVIKRVDTNAQLAITSIELLPDSFDEKFVVGKRSIGGSVSEFNIEYISYDDNNAYSPTEKFDVSETWLENPEKKYYIHKITDIALVESSFPVGYSFLDSEDYQYFGYYDKDKNMTISQHNKLTDTWHHTMLNSKIGWDTHNYISMIVDNEGYLHISGNMHKHPIKYWRSKNPNDISEIQEIHYMVGKEENSTTYPEFLRTIDGKILFHYRQGESGSGYEVYNIWRPNIMSWERFLDTPMIDGKGLRNAYMRGPVKGPDNYYHLLWMWRENANCETNHTLSYARSRDLKQWESIRGEKIDGSITIADTCLVVDPTPIKQGLINTSFQFGFDSKNQPIISYVKYDFLGNTQLYVARFNQSLSQWNIKSLTKWDYRWYFAGMNTISVDVTNSKPYISDNGIAFPYFHIKYGSAEVVVEEETLEPIGLQQRAKNYPSEVDSVQMIWDKPIAVNKKIIDNKYLLRWETQGPNNDAKPSGILPDPTMLQLYEYYDYPINTTSLNEKNEDKRFTIIVKENKIIINKLFKDDDVFIYDMFGRIYFNQAEISSKIELEIFQKGFFLIQVGNEIQKILI